MVVELDVRVTRVFGDGRRTWSRVVLGVFGLSGPVLAMVVVHVRFGEVLDESNIFGATVVVHGPCNVDRSGSDLRVLPT